MPSMGLEAGLVDLAVVAEAAGRHLAPVPIVEALVATRVLGVDAGTVATIALRPGARLVPAGAVADVVVALDGDELVAVRSRPPGAAPANLGSAPVADRDLDSGERTVVARGPEAHERFERALDEWRVLTAAALVGLAQGALDIGVAYVKERHQFGVPIGSFQSVQHRLADVATAVDGAACSRTRRRDRPSPCACRMAFVFCADGRAGGGGGIAPRPRRLRLHARVRHPAALPPGQGVRPLAAGDPAARAPDAVRGPAASCRMDFRPTRRAFRAEVRAFLGRAPPRRRRRAGPRDRHDARLGLPPGAGRARLSAGRGPRPGGRRRSATTSAGCSRSCTVRRTDRGSACARHARARAAPTPSRRTVVPRILGGRGPVLPRLQRARRRVRRRRRRDPGSARR